MYINTYRYMNAQEEDILMQMYHCNPKNISISRFINLVQPPIQNK